MIESLDLPPLPEGWVWTKVGEIMSFEYGKGLRKDKRDPDGTVPVYGSNGIVGHHSESLVKEFSLIVGRKGAIGEVHASDGPCWPIDTTYYIVPPKGIAPRFLFYLLSNLDLRSLDKSTAIPGLNRNDAYALPIPLPPLPEQHRIVAKIEELFTKLDAGVKSLEKTKAQLKRYRQSVLKYAFEGKLTEEWRERHKDELEPASMLLEQIKEERKKTLKGKYKELPPLDTSDLPELPEGWMWTKVGEIAWVTKLAGFEFTKYFKYQESGPVRVVRGLNVGFGNFKANNFKYIDESISNALPRSQLRGGELLIAYVGTLGSTAILPKDGHRYHLGPNVGKIVIDKTIDDAKFLLFFILSSTGQDLIISTSKAVTQSSLSMQQIRSLAIPLASLAEQHKIVEEIERRFSVADDVEKAMDQSLKQAERLRHSILKTAFEGKLMPQDPTDEPASVLLERIKAEREKREIEAKSKTKNKRKRDLVLKQRRFNEYVK